MKWNRLAEALVLITLIAVSVQSVQAADEPAELKGDVVKIR